MKYIFWGGKAIGNTLLSGLIDNGRIPEGIILYKDIIDPVLLEKAGSLGTSILEINSFKKSQGEIISFIKKLDVDCYISVAFPFILSPEILSLVNYPINVHTGAIPRYRGHHPISAAFLNDEAYQATTVHIMEPEVDSGSILHQDFIKVENEDNIVTVRDKLIDLSLKLLLVTIDQLEQGVLYSRKQVGEPIWAPKRTPEDSRIDFKKSSRYLHNFIRALVDPYPNAFAFKGEKCIKFKQSVSSNTPGKVLEDLGNQRYVISTGDGIILVETDSPLEINDILE
jgi:methionyl-tRNA formyltransferase